MLLPIAHFVISGGDKVKESINNWVSRLHQRTKKTADQIGVTLQEVLIGVAVAAVVAAGAILLGPRFIGQGQAAASRQTLQAAVTATESTYARIVPGGERNWLGVELPAGTDTGALEVVYSELLTVNAVKASNDLGEDMRFIPWLDDATSCADGAWASSGRSAGTPEAAAYDSIPDNTTTPNCIFDADDISELKEKTVWVQVIDEIDDVGGTSTADILAGKAVRMGLRAPNGSTMCVISIKRSTPNDIIGRGYQATNEETSETEPADCGLLDSAATVKGGDEWPSQQTDSSLGDPAEAASAYGD